MFAASLCLAGSVGKNALGFGLADTGAGVGFDRLDGGEGPFFRAFLRHSLTRTTRQQAARGR